MNDRGRPEVPTLAMVRVIAIAMLIAPLVFGGIVAYVRGSERFGGTFDVPFFDVGAAGIGVVLAAIAFAVRGALFSRGAAGPAAMRPLAYLTATLVFFALLEGAILLNIVVALLVPEPWANVGAAAIVFALAASSLPNEHQRDNAGLSG